MHHGAKIRRHCGEPQNAEMRVFKRRQACVAPRAEPVNERPKNPVLHVALIFGDCMPRRSGPSTALKSPILLLAKRISAKAARVIICRDTVGERGRKAFRCVGAESVKRRRIRIIRKSKQCVRGFFRIVWLRAV